MNQIQIPASVGELFDKISILTIKTEQLTDAKKLENVRYELALLTQVQKEQVPNKPELAALAAQLKQVNGDLWKIEDDIRECERAKDFGSTFVELARAVYVTNDKRAALKKQVDVLLGSQVTEEKSYAAY